MWPLIPSLFAFVVCALVILYAGVKLTITAGQLAKITGLGELLTGAILIGFVTSLSGLVTSVSAAYSGHASLSISNSLGGIAAQTVFLVVADWFYRHANLEHAAASEANLLQGVMLIVLLALSMIAMATPDIEILSIHPISAILIVAYIFGLKLIVGAQRYPMWHPRVTSLTEQENINKATATRRSYGTVLWLSFIVLAIVVAIAGWCLSQSAIAISHYAGFDESVVGGVLTAMVTSLPELVVAITAVRKGLLTLAVGDILGGNVFDVLFLSASDIAYRQGSIYAAITAKELFWVAMTILLAAILILGLLRRERHGVGNIGFESFLILITYLLGVIVLALS